MIYTNIAFLIVVLYCVYYDNYQGGSTPIMIAAMKGHIDIILMLIRRRANLNHSNNVSMCLIVNI